MNEPKLRFPEFKGEWEEKTLGEVCDSILVGFPFKGEDITDDASGHPILRAFSIGEGIIRHGKDYDKYYPYDAEKLKKYEVRNGDIVISMDGSVGKNIAMVSEKEERNLLIQRVARLRITDYPIHLIFQQIISQRFKDYAAGEKKGAVIAHISQKQIELFPIYIPNSPAEQQKIASCLSAMDDLIAAQAEKVEDLKEKKTGLMQQLFPQPGETTPRLRFPEFTGEWKEYEFGDCFEIGSGRDYKHLDEGHIPVYGSGGYMCSVNDYLYDGESACIGRKGTINNPILLSGKFWTVDTLFYTYNYVNTTAYFIYLLFQNIDWMKHNEAGGVPSLSKNIIKKIKVFIPSLTEQQKISDCLSALDDQIAAETEKHTALKDYKKGLMQQLFPQPAK